MQKEALAKILNIAETVWIAVMLVNAYGFGYELEVPFYFLALPLALFIGNSWALVRTKNVALYFVQLLGLMLLLTGGVTYVLAVFCLVPLLFLPGFYPKRWVKTTAMVVTVMAATLAILSAYTLWTAPAPEIAVEQSYPQNNALLEVRRQTVDVEVGPNILRGVWFEKRALGCTFTRMLYVCADEREITLSWQDGDTALINGTPCSVYFSRLTSE